MISLSHAATRNQTIITIPYYTYYEKNYHSIDNCCVLHLESKKVNDKKRRAIQPNRKGKCSQPSLSNAKDNTYNFGRMSMYFMATRSLSDLENLWALDTGCSQYITHQKKDFVTFQSYIGGPITRIDRIQIQLAGQRTIKLACNVQKCQIIILFSNRLYCLTNGVNLISVSQLLPKHSVNVTFHQDHAKIYASGQTFIVAQYDGLYL